MIKLGDLIKQHRKEKGLTQAELAKLVGVSQPAIGKYESGDRQPSIQLTTKMSEALNCNLLQEYESAMSDYIGVDMYVDPEYYANQPTHEIINYLALSSGYDFEIIHKGTGLFSDFYRFFNDSDEIITHFWDIEMLVDKMCEHMLIDFKDYLRIQRRKANTEANKSVNATSSKENSDGEQD